MNDKELLELAAKHGFTNAALHAYTLELLAFAHAIRDAALEEAAAMTNSENINLPIPQSRSTVGLERCALCRKWHKSKHYDCQHNGPWGGCSTKRETEFQPKKVRSNAVLRGDSGLIAGVPLESTVRQEG